jgi:uncharacterized protein
MIFVDTGAWYALAIPSDVDHERAKEFLAASTQPLVTSDYVIDELLTLFVVRGQKSQGMEWRHDVLENGGTHLIRVSEADFANALHIYDEFADKSWSFTDCISYVLMQRLNIAQAFSFDQHFHQFGTVTVLPPLT